MFPRGKNHDKKDENNDIIKNKKNQKKNENLYQDILFGNTLNKRKRITKSVEDVDDIKNIKKLKKTHNNNTKNEKNKNICENIKNYFFSGNLIYGEIINIQKNGLTVLIYGTTQYGHVPFENCSNQFKELYNEQENEINLILNNENILKNDQNIIKLRKKFNKIRSYLINKLFFIGQYIPCTILSINKQKKTLKNNKNNDKNFHKISYYIELTCNISDVNRGITLSQLYRGCIIYGNVVSVEDHGYLINLGIDSTSSFLPFHENKKNDSDIDSDDDENNLLKIGTILPLIIKKINNSTRTITLSFHEKKYIQDDNNENDSDNNDDSENDNNNNNNDNIILPNFISEKRFIKRQLTYSYLRPGMIFEITNVNLIYDDKSINVSFGYNQFQGDILNDYIDDQSIINDEEKNKFIGKKVRIIFSMPSMKKIFLSLLPETIQLKKSTEVIKYELKLNKKKELEIKNNLNNIDQNNQKNIQKRIKNGNIVSGIIIETHKNTLIVRLADGTQAILPINHISDHPNANGMKESIINYYKPGIPIKKAIVIDTTKDLPLISMKPLLLYSLDHKNDINWPISFNDIEVNKLHVGTLIRILSYGFFVQFSSNLTTLIPKSLISDSSFIDDLDNILKVGDTIICLIKEIKKDNKTLSTIKLSYINKYINKDIINNIDIFYLDSFFKSISYGIKSSDNNKINNQSKYKHLINWNSYPLSSLIELEVVAKKPYGIILSDLNTNTMFYCSNDHSIECNIGDSVKVRILDISFEHNLFEVSMLSGIVKYGKKKKMKNFNKLNINTKVKATVLLIREYYVLVMLKNIIDNDNDNNNIMGILAWVPRRSYYQPFQQLDETKLNNNNNENYIIGEEYNFIVLRSNILYNEINDYTYLYPHNHIMILKLDNNNNNNNNNNNDKKKTIGKHKDQDDIIINKGDIVNGYIDYKIKPIDPPCLMLRLNNIHGKNIAKIDITELNDIDDWIDLSNNKIKELYKQKQLLKCKIIDIRKSKKYKKLKIISASIRPSRLNNENNTEEEKDNMNELPKIGDLVKGYINNITPKGCFISLANNNKGRVLLKDLSDKFVEKPKEKFPIGKLVMARVLKVHDNGKIDLSLRPSAVIPKSERKKKNDMDIDEDDDNDDSDDNDDNDDDDSDDSDNDDSDDGNNDDDSDDDSDDDNDDDDDDNDDDDNDDDDDDSEEDAIKKMIKKAMLKHDLVDENDSGSDNDSGSNDDEDGDDDDSGSDDDDDDDFVPSNIDSSFGDLLFGQKNNLQKYTGIKINETMEWDDWNMNLDNNNNNNSDSSDTDSDTDSDDSDDDDNNNNNNKSRKSRKKLIEKNQEEEYIRKIEEENLNGNQLPQKADDYEKLLLALPNSSYLWIQYMAFKLSMADIDEARHIGKRALKTINFREEEEKLNIWIALLNLEHKHGTKTTLNLLISDALQYNNKEKIYIFLSEMFIKSKQRKDAEDIFRKMIKKFRNKPNIWYRYEKFLMTDGRHEEARELLSRSLQSLPNYEHIQTIMKYGDLEYEIGSKDRGRTIYEGLLSTYPKRIDIWFVYIDKEIKYNNINKARLLFKRLITLNLSLKKMKNIFKKFIKFELNYGDDNTIEFVKEKAKEFAEKI